MKFTRRALLSCAAATLAVSFAYPATAAPDAPHVTLKTNMGSIVIELYPQKAPMTVGNFLEYVKDGQYNGTIFHRVIGNFMIQGGGFDQKMHEKPTRPPIKNEANNGLKNTVYTVAMARTSAPHSATAQFFINTADNDMLDYPGQDGWGYAVFGKVVGGTDVVDRIKQVKTGSNGMYQDVPVTPVMIESATVTK
ncbi:MAG: ppiB1 [Herbaspirillum sp.]|jgi:cyclophilin family peptidyl-prolyl cis-trans isomerase|nr:ppiB1 [Herbaspirillum sp.]